MNVIRRLADDVAQFIDRFFMVFICDSLRSFALFSFFLAQQNHADHRHEQQTETISTAVCIG